LVDPLTMGIALGLLVGKVVGVFGSAFVVIKADWADVPIGAGMLQLLGIALLCGIGFTMSLFIGLLAFADDPVLQEEVKIGILCGSGLSGILGWIVLRFAPRQIPAPGLA
jgi:NhaA family Na+:H+ antiporter